MRGRWLRKRELAKRDPGGPVGSHFATSRFRTFWPLVCLLASLALVPTLTRAQDDDLLAMIPPELGEEAESDELVAFRLTQLERFVKAREAAEKVVAANPHSYVGHYVLAFAQHYGEANFPRALYHADIALREMEQRHGRDPADGPWRWHARILRELAAIHGDLEHHDERLAYTARYNELYEPDMLAERAWSLMKLGRYDEARLAAVTGLETEDPRQVEVALNALCAIEFEAGNDSVSYDACGRALEYGRAQPGGATTVDLTNFAEAARSVFRLDEAERIGLEATRAQPSWYGNPWLELAELYTREARYPEALDALKEVPRYRTQRPPHVRDSDRSEGRRAIAAFFLVVGRPLDAIRLTEKARIAPDRRAHNSRDPAQDIALAALLDRRARLVAAELRDEARPGLPFYERPFDWVSTQGLRFEAWMSGREAAKMFADEEKLVGWFEIGTARAAVVPPWLASELVEILGAGVVAEAVRLAREDDDRDGSDAYYDAFEAEAALGEGDDERAAELAQRAIDRLGPAEELLRTRARAILAEAKRRTDDWDEALPLYENALISDPGVFRRLGLTIPVQFAETHDDTAADVVDLLESSPRLDESERGLIVQARGNEVCILSEEGSSLGCGTTTALDGGEEHDDFVVRIAAGFHEQAFAPRIALTQADANSLDGSNRVGRDALETLGPGLDTLDE